MNLTSPKKQVQNIKEITPVRLSTVKDRSPPE